MKIGKIIIYTLAIVLGVLMFVYAEYDDSPGGQLIGLIFIFTGTFGLIRLWRKK